MAGRAPSPSRSSTNSAAIGPGDRPGRRRRLYLRDHHLSRGAHRHHRGPGRRAGRGCVDDGRAGRRHARWTLTTSTSSSTARPSGVPGCSRSGRWRPRKLVSVTTVDENAVCTAMLDLYQNEGIIAEPADARCRWPDSGDRTGSRVDGGVPDLRRQQRRLPLRRGAGAFVGAPMGQKHYFLVDFPQEPGALREGSGQRDIAISPTCRIRPSAIGPVAAVVDAGMLDRMAQIDAEERAQRRARSAAPRASQWGAAKNAVLESFTFADEEDE